MLNIEARDEIIALLRSLQIPKNYKFILTYSNSGKEVVLNIYKETHLLGLDIFRRWELERMISAEDYDDLLVLIKKYPKFIETEVVINGGSGAIISSN